MADQQNPRRGWRETPAGGTPASGASHRPGAASKRKQIFTILAVMLALAGAVAGILYWLRPVPKPYLVPVFISEYTNKAIPVNFQAESERKALADGHYFDGTFASQEKKPLLQELAELKNRSSDTVVLYVCAFARAAEKEVLLLPGDFNPDDSQTAVKLSKVLEMLQQCPAGHKLLILDTMRPLADSRLGVLTNDIASRIDPELKAVEDPHRLVLLSCSPGQVSLASEDLGRSVFNYYVEEGLRGWADGYDGSKPDGRVSVRELAEFVKRRVDRWAEHNLGTRQTPVLFPKESKDDFPLIVLERGQTKSQDPELEEREVRKYPDVLKSAWEERDRAWEQGGFQLAPRAGRQLEAYLLRAELQWRSGMELARLEPEIKNQLAEFKKHLDQARGSFQDQTRSLTLARESKPLDEKVTKDVKDFEKVSKDLKDLMAKAGELLKDKGARDKFLDDNKGKQFQVDCAAFDLAVADLSNPSADTIDKIRFLGMLLQAQEPQPRYVETLMLSNYLANWPASLMTPALAQRAIEVVQKGEEALSKPRVFPWIRPLLEAAAQNRHTAEVYLASPRCVSVDAVENQLKKAVDAYIEVSNSRETLLRAEQSLDEALIRLPAYLPYLEAPRHNEEAWEHAVQAANDLHQALSQYPPEGISLDDLRKKIREIGEKADGLRTHWNDLRRPFEPDHVREMVKNVQESIKRGGQPDASLSVEIQSMLATPMLKASDRVELWRAGRDLSGKLNQETMKSDHDDNNAQPLQLTKSLSDFGQKHWEKERGAKRARWALALLKLSGLGASELQGLEDKVNQIANQSGPSAWDDLAASLRTAWVDDVPRKLEQSSPQAKDRRNVPYPPFDTRLDDPNNPNPSLSSAAAELKQWLARWYQYESQDLRACQALPASEFYAAAARDYGAPQGEMAIQFSGDKEVPPLTTSKPVETIAVQLKLSGVAAEKPVKVNTLTTDDGWLETPGPAELRDPGVTRTLPIRVLLKGVQKPSTPKPLGFLVQARVNDRVFHQKVRVNLESQPEIILSVKRSDEPKDIGPELILRPNKNRLSYYVYLHNRTDTAYKQLTVELLDGEKPVSDRIPVTDVKKFEGPRLINKFGNPSDKLLKEFHGPLQIRLRDVEEDNKVLVTKRLDVRILNPRDYVEVGDIVFKPGAAGQKNRLQVPVRAKMDFPEPGCEVELDLPSDLPPPEAGNLKVTLSKKGEEQVLFAEGLPLKQPVESFVYLTVDGVPRALIYKTTFNLGGGETKPERFDDPAVRIPAFPTPYVLASKEFKVPVQVDNPRGASLLLELWRKDADGSVHLERKAEHGEARYQHLGFSPQGEEGALLFEAQIGDWVMQLDTAKISGPRELRATLRTKDGKAPLTDSKLVMLDGTPPTNLKKIDAHQVGNMAEVTVQGEGYSGIQKVLVYVGKAEGGKPPSSDPVEADFDKDKKAWTARIPVPVAKVGNVDLTAEFINGVGLKDFLVFQVKMNAAAGPAGNGAPAKPGSISGLVERNGRSEPKAKVKLEGANVKDPLSLTADDRGHYKFPEVPPGTYKVTAKTEEGKASGEITVTVKPGEEKTNQTISVSR